jgi:hypothetical protein
VACWGLVISCEKSSRTITANDGNGEDEKHMGLLVDEIITLIALGDSRHPKD